MDSMTKENISDFLNKLQEMHSISNIWEKVLNLLRSLQPDISDEALALFCIYFSRLNDGNICIPLDESLFRKWNEKWEGLLLVENRLEEKDEDRLYFEKILRAALPQINAKKLPNLIEEISQNTRSANTEPDYSKPFVIDCTKNNERWLFASKYHQAKINIEKRIKILLQNNSVQTGDEDLKRITEYFKNNTVSHIELMPEQSEAILRGQAESLIITGGPGTGKTTVVCYLLWELLKKSSFIDYQLYLAAPSGKAAERIHESVAKALSGLSSEEKKNFPEIYDKLDRVKPYTIHRLLSYNPSVNGFRYNSENQFDEKSIFIIDEASMIDISLFSSLLSAIPEKARVFILGDKDQLPSVQAGAVLGELLDKKTDSVIALTKSNRFNENSAAGRLKNAMQEDTELPSDLLGSTNWEKWKTNNIFTIPDNKKNEQEKKPKEFPVTSFTPVKSYKEKSKQIEEIITLWSSCFFDAIARNANKDLTGYTDSELNELWEKAIAARILCAERKGIQGVEEINKRISQQIIKSLGDKNLSSEEYFPGQLLMLTKNQKTFCLYNGDSGIVVKNENLLYLMLKKETQKNATGEEADLDKEMKLQGIFKKGSFIFYPLHLLPKESIETAYAITIHKSQGSEYPAILVFLPEQKGHPLLNRQIVYTAITRTAGSTYIYADYDTLEAARATVIQRDTQIEL